MSINQWHCVLINNNLWNKHAQYHDNSHLLGVKYKLERVHGDEKTSNKACDVVLWHYNNMWSSWENLAYGIFYENRVWCIFDRLYHRANLHSKFRPIVQVKVKPWFLHQCLKADITGLLQLRKSDRPPHERSILALQPDTNLIS